MSLYMLLRLRLSPKEIQSFFKSVTQLTVKFYAEKRLDKIEKYIRQYKKKYTCFIYRKFRFHLFGSPCHAFFRSYFVPFYFFPLHIFTFIFLLNLFVKVTKFISNRIICCYNRYLKFWNKWTQKLDFLWWVALSFLLCRNNNFL